VGTEKNRNIDLKKNLENKKVLIENLKNLLNLDNKMNEKYLEFKKIQDEWFKIGPVPRVDNGIVWNNFQHHIKNFYDYLHLNRKFKEIDIKYNLEQKETVIKQAEELLRNEDKIRSYKYFERLNKRWKYEIGPTKKENESKLNEKFSEIGKEIQKNKKEFDLNKDSILAENLLKKESHLNEIKNLISKECNNTKDWQRKIKEFERIKKILETTGPIPSNKKNDYWKKYKDTIKDYYSSKNIFYKNLKRIYKENIEKQEILLGKAKILKNTENLEQNKKEIIILQKEWKKINPVPYKVNEKNWKQFKSICNQFFNKIDEEKVIKIREIKKNQENQNKFIREIEINSSNINLEELLKKWESLGQKSKENEIKFEKYVLKKLKSDGLSVEQSKIKLFEIKTQTMSSNEKDKKILILNKELEKLKKEVSTLENNLSFFNEKSKENKMLNKVYKDIEKNKLNIQNIISQKKLLKN
tara:strand:+ start:15066 stop:16475 length:1410 start_codon:yes stop_codon:yes gene_type:complete